MVSCALRSCRNRNNVQKKKSSGITFHRFPKDPVARSNWIKFVHRGDWEPTKYSVLCSEHFAETCIDRTSLCNVRLRVNAVPTCHGIEDESVIPTQVKIADILIQPSTSQDYPKKEVYGGSKLDLPNTMAASTSEVHSPHRHKSINYMPDIETTPRKRGILRKLKHALQVSSERKRKLRIVRKKVVRRDKRIASLTTILKDLRKKNFMQEEALEVISKLGGPQEFFLRQYKKVRGIPLPKRYSEELKVFALTLHFYSPAAYNYVRRTFNTCLPHTRTLSRWYQNVDGEPGFTSEAFEALRVKAASEKSKINCSLIIDEMAIRQHEEWVPQKNKCYGYVDMGTGSNENTLAKDALVFLLNCINGHWKIPVGYFLVAGLTGDQKKGLILQCLEKCHDVGVDVVSVTFDGPPVNFTMATRLGCSLQHSNIQSHFKHPSTNEDVVIFLDPAHMIKLVRNTIGEKYSLVDDENKLIEWRYFRQLHDLQEEESFHLANKLRTQHIAFSKQKMKVRLAAQLFSESVAIAMEFCKDDLNLKEFREVGATVKFIRVVNNLFDILNSRNLLQLGFKKPLSISNYEGVVIFLDRANQYISSLKTHVDGRLILDSDRHTGFLGLKICISSLKFLFSRLVMTNILSFLPVYKVSQDHIELFFSSVRSQGGYNNNPTARQFQSAYKKLLVHVELRESFRGNCIPLEQLSILRCDAVRHINITSRQSRILETEESDSIELDHDYLPDSLSEFSKKIIAYIAGYVVFYLRKKIICEQCIDALISTNRDMSVYSFIEKKEKKSLQYPSEDVLDICIKCEQIFKNRCVGLNTFNVSTDALTNLVLKQFIYKNIFKNLEVHAFDQYALDNHRVLLIKAIANKYINVRMYYFCKNKTDKSTSIRHHHNKIVLFKGQ